MKKLFVLGSLITIFLFLFGCQSEAPLSPYDQDTTSLEKGRIKFTGDLTLNESDAGFVKISLNWNALTGATGYLITYYNLRDGMQKEVELPGTQTSLDIDYAMLQVTGNTCEITIQAIKEKKGEEVLFASGSQNFTYTGTAVAEITNITGSISQSSVALNYVQLIADWDDIAGTSLYGLKVYSSWGEVYTLSSFGSSFGPTAFGTHELADGEFISVIFKAWDGSTLKGIGNAKFTYTE